MTNTPEYVEALFAVWHGGYAAVPINAKLHPREFAYILGDSGARMCIVTEDLAEPIAGIADELPELRAVVAAGSAGLCEALRRRALRRVGSRTRRPRMAVLHLGHHGAPQGRDAQPPQPAGDDAQLLRRCRPGRRGQHHRPRRADVARLRHVPPAPHRQGRLPGDPGEQGLQRRRVPRPPPLPLRSDGVLRTDHGDPAGQRAVAGLGRPRQPAHHRLWRRADVCRGLPARARCAGTQAGPDLRPGRGRR